MKYRFTLTMPDGAKSNVNVDDSMTMWNFLRLLLERGAAMVSVPQVGTPPHDWTIPTVMRSAATYGRNDPIPATYLKMPLPEKQEDGRWGFGPKGHSTVEAYAQGTYEPKSQAVRAMLDELSREPDEWHAVGADPRNTGYTQADAERETKANFANLKSSRQLRWQAGYIPRGTGVPVALGSGATLEEAVNKAVGAMPEGVDSMAFIRVWSHPSFAETLNRPMKVDEVPEWMKVQKW